MTVNGSDWSHHNISPSPTLFDFIIHKATQGDYMRDTRYYERATLIRSLGKVWGAYHFIDTRVSARDQIDYFQSYARIQPGDIVALDFEDNNYWHAYSRRVVAENGKLCMQELIRRYPNNRVVIYCNRSTYRDYVQAFSIPLGDGLWLASPGVEPPWPWVIWQYGMGGLDYDRANFDTFAHMREWAHKTTAPVEDDMTPEQDRMLRLVYAQLVGAGSTDGTAKIDTYPGWPERDELAGYDGNKTVVDYQRTILALQRRQEDEIAALRTQVDNLNNKGVPMSTLAEITFRPTAEPIALVDEPPL
jgi:Glycosyl hydrolases family 25